MVGESLCGVTVSPRLVHCFCPVMSWNFLFITNLPGRSGVFLLHLSAFRASPLITLWKTMAVIQPHCSHTFTKVRLLQPCYVQISSHCSFEVYASGQSCLIFIYASEFAANIKIYVCLFFSVPGFLFLIFPWIHSTIPAHSCAEGNEIYSMVTVRPEMYAL